jgi:hypothetical protein
LDRLSETDDADEARDHKVIARYLKHFLENVPEEVDGTIQAAKYAIEHPEDKPDLSTGTPYMEDDGTTDEPAEY